MMRLFLEKGYRDSKKRISANIIELLTSDSCPCVITLFSLDNYLYQSQEIFGVNYSNLKGDFLYQRGFIVNNKFYEIKTKGKILVAREVQEDIFGNTQAIQEPEGKRFIIEPDRTTGLEALSLFLREGYRKE